MAWSTPAAIDEVLQTTANQAAKEVVAQVRRWLRMLLSVRTRSAPILIKCGRELWRNFPGLQDVAMGDVELVSWPR